jgi:hypothetical protein
MPIYGLPFLGRLNVPKELGKVPILQLHDRSDKTIPPNGGLTEDGFLYESITTTLSVWARNHSCKISSNLTGVVTKFEGGNRNMVCQEYKKC